MLKQVIQIGSKPTNPEDVNARAAPAAGSIKL